MKKVIRFLFICVLALTAAVFFYGPEKSAELIATKVISTQVRGLYLSAPQAEHTCGIVFGCSIRSEYFEERLQIASDLFHSGKVESLFLSGDGRDRHYDEPAAMKSALLKRGIPASALILDRAGLSTAETVRNAITEYGIKDAYLVTQRFHMPRALFLAQHYGLEVTPAIAAHLTTFELDPQRERRASVKALLHVLGLEDLVIQLLSQASPHYQELASL